MLAKLGDGYCFHVMCVCVKGFSPNLVEINLGRISLCDKLWELIGCGVGGAMTKVFLLLTISKLVT